MATIRSRHSKTASSAPRVARSKARTSLSKARGAPVIEAVFNATYEEILRVGYGGLSIEDVAARAGVNKTTVYRRWPTKVDLVAAALVALPPQFGPLPNAGSFRGDVIEFALSIVRFFHTIAGRAIMRLALVEVGVPKRLEFQHVKDAFDAHGETQGLKAIVNRAIARGELPRSFDHQVFIDALSSTLSFRCLGPNESPDRDFVERLIDGLLMGLLPRPTAPSSPHPTKKTARKPRT